MSTKTPNPAQGGGGSFFDFCASTRRPVDQKETSIFDSISEFFGMGCTSRRSGIPFFDRDRISTQDKEKLLKNLFKAQFERSSILDSKSLEREITDDLGRVTKGVSCSECYIFKETNKTEFKQVEQHIDQQNPFTIFSLFEGINGREVATFLQSRAPVVTLTLLQQGLSPREVLLRTFHELEANVLSQAGWSQQGACGLVSIVDHVNGILFTATLGSSRGFLIRKGGGLYALSNIRSFSSKHDIQRLDHAIKALHEQRSTCYLPFTGEYRWPNAQQGVGCSRAFGLLAYNSYRGLNQKLWPISAKPKITCVGLKEGDTVILGTKSFFDTFPIEHFEEKMHKKPKHDLRLLLAETMSLGAEIKEFSAVAAARFREKK
ncbi:MAG: protein phosphatase 2C family protein [Chlamydiae bacterium]|nr:protein phosphatase 2C family protein [Chlamydiota bacterium]